MHLNFITVTAQPDSMALEKNNNSILSSFKKPVAPMLSSKDKQGSAIDLNIAGLPLIVNCKPIQQNFTRMNRFCIQPIWSIGPSVGSSGSGSSSGSSTSQPRPHQHETVTVYELGEIEIHGRHVESLHFLQIRSSMRNFSLLASAKTWWCKDWSTSINKNVLAVYCNGRVSFKAFIKIMWQCGRNDIKLDAGDSSITVYRVSFEPSCSYRALWTSRCPSRTVYEHWSCWLSYSGWFVLLARNRLWCY